MAADQIIAFSPVVDDENGQRAGPRVESGQREQALRQNVGHADMPPFRARGRGGLSRSGRLGRDKQKREQQERHSFSETTPEPACRLHFLNLT